MPLDSVQAVLGHADPKTTLLYTRLALGRAREEYDAAMAAIAGMAHDGRARIGAPQFAEISSDFPAPTDRVDPDTPLDRAGKIE